MYKHEILEKIEKESNRLDTLKAICDYYKRQNDNSYRMERCQNAIEKSVNKLFELSQKLNKK